MASKKKDVRPVITLACSDCKERNYTSEKNRRNDPGRLELHKETWLICREPGCGRKYPIVDDIPDMLVETGETRFEKVTGNGLHAEAACEGVCLGGELGFRP